MDFARLKMILPPIETLVREWLPGGKIEGREWVVRNPTRSDKKPGSFKVNLDTGLWSDFATQDEGDIISLFGYLKGLDVGMAGRMLESLYGRPDVPTPTPRPKPAAHTDAPTDATTDVTDCDIKPGVIAPVPNDAPSWMLTARNPVMAWEYRDAAGKLLGVICRWETAGGKDIRPYTYRGTTDAAQWEQGWFKDPSPLYGLDRLAAGEGKPVWIVEGEKAADVLQEARDDIVVVTWHGGAKRVLKSDWSPVAGRDITLWPDNDTLGKQAMVKLAKKIKPSGMVVIPDWKPEKWDAADAVSEGMDMMTVEVKSVKAPAVQPEIPDKIKWPFRFAGFDHGTYFYIPKAMGQIIALPAGAHTKTSLLTLAPLEFWERNFGGEKGVAWNSAVNILFRCQEKVGVHNPDLVRGRGVWHDDGRIVMHNGNRLYCKGEAHELDTLETKYIYEMRPEVTLDYGEPMDQEDAARLANVCEMITWEYGESAKHLVGWLVCASICGVLDWRPGIWICGAVGSGKSWIVDHVVRPITGPATIYSCGVSTAAGIRQRIAHDAVPVLMDEAEGNNQGQERAIEEVLALMRQSSSDSGAKIFRGTVSGRAIDFTIRSIFCFASINAGQHHTSDETRVTSLLLYPDKRVDREERYERLCRIVDGMLTEDYCQLFRSRALAMADTITKTVKVFSMVISSRLSSKRIGDQLGALMAGWWSTQSDEVIDIEAAKEIIGMQEFKNEMSMIEMSDEQKCFNLIMEMPVKLKTERGVDETTISEGIARLIEVSDYELSDTMLRYGVKVDIGKKIVYIQSSNKRIMVHLCGTPWSRPYVKTLSRLPGAINAGQIQFLPAMKNVAVGLPFKLFQEV